MGSHSPGFSGEYQWELDIARTQLVALADAVPEAIYGWSPVNGARSFSAVLVHIASVNMGLLRIAGVDFDGWTELYGEEADVPAMVRRNMSFEGTITDKDAAIAFLKRSFDAVQQAFHLLSAQDLEKPVDFGESTTVRRIFLRILAHSHEHMGQAIAYARTYGSRMPWPDPLREFESASAKQGT